MGDKSIVPGMFMSASSFQRNMYAEISAVHVLPPLDGILMYSLEWVDMTGAKRYISSSNVLAVCKEIPCDGILIGLKKSEEKWKRY